MSENPPEEQSERTNEAMIESSAPECSDSSVKNPETSGISSAADDDNKSLEFAGKLMENGEIAFKRDEYPEAADLFSRALEIRVAHYGELAPECVYTYFKYGYALLNKAQEEADPFGAVPKKDAQSQQGSVKVENEKNNVEPESSIVSVSSRHVQSASSTQQQGTDDVPENGVKDEDMESDKEEEEDGDPEENESDLDLAWKMLDLARSISEKRSQETIVLVNTLSALAEVSLEREEIEMALSDYEKALSMLERLVEPDHRQIAELNFRICLTLEVGCREREAIPYCERAISVCKSRVQRLTDEMKSTSESVSSSAASDVNQGVQNSSAEKTVSDKLAEIESITSILSDMEKKLEDLQPVESNQESMLLADIFKMVYAKARASVEQASASGAACSSRVGAAYNNGDFDSPTVSTAHSNVTGGVTHLGVVGRGVKRVVISSSNVESSPTKKPSIDPKPDTGDSKAS